VTAQPRPMRGRSLPAALLGALAVLAALFVLPGGSATVAASPSFGPAATVRGTAALGNGLREGRDQVRLLPRRGTRAESAGAAVRDGRAGTRQGPAPAAALAAAVALGLLVATGLVVAGSGGGLSRRTPGTRRDRAPPVLAFA
jgi:hypothetical protein